MSDHRRYVPVLKGRAGEFEAMANLDAATRARLTPLFEFSGPPTSTAALGEDVDTFVEGIRGAWRDPGQVFVDMLSIRPTLRPADGRHYVDVAMGLARVLNLHAVPVTGLGRDVAFTRAVADAAATDARGVGIRVRSADMEPAHTLDQRLRALTRALCVAPADSHLILDFEHLPLTTPGSAAASANRILHALTSLDSWRTATVLSAAFPNELASIRGAALLPRNDWLAWRRLIDAPTGKRLPGYGDYTVSGPAHPSIAWASIPNIRYTTPEHWFVARDGRRHQMDEFHRLALLVRRSPDAAFRGIEHCRGCEYIVGCSARGVHPGNATTWRMVGTCHHLTTVAEQLSTIPGAG